MLLRASGKLAGEPVDLRVVTDAGAAGESGVAEADALLAFSDALVAHDGDALPRARADLLERLGPEGLVDAAAVASNFERMDRIADATGIPLDAPLAMMTEDLRTELDLGRFASAANTPAVGAAQRTAARALQPLLPRLMKLAGALRRRLDRR